MFRLSRALKESTVHAATFVSLIALVACSAEDGEGAPSSTVPPFSGQSPQNTSPLDPVNGGGSEPSSIGTMTPVGTPSGDTATNIPLAPPAATGSDGPGTSPTSEPPPAEPPPGEPPPGEPPPAEPPPAEPPPAEPPPAQPPSFVENSGVGCAVPTLPGAGALPAIARLPDPFTRIDGTRIASRADWRCRRQEIKELAEQYIYGDKPARPQTVSGTVSNTSITVNVSNQGRSTSFNVSVQLPTSGSAPYPALVSVGGFSQNDLVRSEGVAIINLDPFAVGDEGGSRANKQGAFYDIYGAQSFTGLLAAWSWGVSRIIDVIEQSGGNVLKADALAVAGCSRFGKAAFTIGAFDERIALTIPFESGSGGVPIWRGIPGEGAQSLSSAYGETYWLGDAFGSFINGAVATLPVDTHEIVAMVAPRGLLILDNPHIANLGPESAHVAALAGAEVFRALGAGANISYHSAVASGTHCQARPEHQEPLRQNLRKFLLKTGNAPGAITAAASTTGNLAEWRNWTTPTLN
jgi:glucuronyl esterase-like protein